MDKEKEIRLDQTKKVFKVLVDLIQNEKSCSYRYLIYDLLGFEHENYVDLMDGLAITNRLSDFEEAMKLIDEVYKYVEEHYPASTINYQEEKYTILNMLRGAKYE